MMAELANKEFMICLASVANRQTGLPSRFRWNLVQVVSATVVALMICHLLQTEIYARGSDQSATRPNVVLIITDDQGYGDMACHGNPVLKTPHLDRLSNQSVRLTNFHVDPTCSPTRAALMTGRYSTRTGVWHTVMGRHMPRPDEVMMPSLFADSGYRTAIFGKWHLGDSYPYRPQDRGFQEVLVHGGGGVGQIPDYWGNDYFDDTYFHNGRPRKFEGYCTDVFFREAIRFITTNRAQPFFVYLTTNAPHGPYRVPEMYSQPYDDKVGDDPELAKFYGMIANIDENVGRLLTRLNELELDSNTIVIFMTDNGTARGASFSDNRGNEGELLSGYNAGLRGRKGSPYEGGHRVPCFVRWPAGGLSPSMERGQLTAHLDLLPTLMELCQLNRPAGIQFDGRSLAGLLSGKAEQWPKRTLFAHHQELPAVEKHRFGCVMAANWRLIARNDLEPMPRFELYDIAVDPGQDTNLSDRRPDVVRQLRAAYDDWWNSLAEEFDNDSEIILGDDRANPTRLTCFEWHGSRRWSQRNVLSASVDNGPWAVEVARAGSYEITLRRWPEEVDAPITAAVEGGQPIEAVEAKIRIGKVEASQPIPAGASAVQFTIRLQQGKTRLQTWLIDATGKSRGAYYAKVERVE